MQQTQSTCFAAGLGASRIIILLFQRAHVITNASCCSNLYLFLLLLRQSVKLYLGAYLFYVDFWNKVMGWLSDTHLLCAGCRLQAASQSNSLTSLRNLKACLTMPNSLRHFSIGFAAPISICLQRPQPEVYCQAVENNRHQSVQES